MRVRVRYDTADEHGETRRERNERFGETSPPLIVPGAVRYIWDWYFSLSESLRRVRDGVCEPVPPSEFLAWAKATGAVVYPSEYAIIRAIDLAFCSEMNKELTDYQQRERERAEQNRKNQPKPYVRRARR